MLPALSQKKKMLVIFESKSRGYLIRIPGDKVSISAISGVGCFSGPDVCVIKNWTWSHSSFVVKISISTSVS